MQLSNNIRYFRKERGLTQEQLAEALGVTASAVYKWEAGLSTPDINLIVGLADLFDTSVDVLLGYEVKDNKRAAAVTRLKDFVHRRDERGMDEADKLLIRYPNCFEIVYQSANLYGLFGFMRRERKLLLHSIELMERARLLIGQNTDPEISEFSINHCIAQAYLAIGENEKAVELYQSNNPQGIYNDFIGCILGKDCDRPDAAVPFTCPRRCFATVIAPALGTIAFGLWGFDIVVLVVTVCYTLSAAQECFILYRKTEQRPEQQKNWLIQFWDGIRYVTGQEDVLALFALVMALNFFVANAEEIINPGIIIQKYAISGALFGMTSSAAVVGTLAAGLFIFQNKWIDLQKNLKKLFLLNSALMVLIGVGALFMTSAPMAYFALFLFLEFLLGLVTSCVNVPLISSLQTRVPIDYQGRFFALLSFSSGLLIPLGITYTGFLASVVGADLAYIINNLCVIVIVLLCGTCI